MKKKPKVIVYDEACVPGGMTWHEAVFVPMLADFECSRCGDIGCDCPHPSDQDNDRP